MSKRILAGFLCIGLLWTAGCGPTSSSSSSGGIVGVETETTTEDTRPMLEQMLSMGYSTFAGLLYTRYTELSNIHSFSFEAVKPESTNVTDESALLFLDGYPKDAFLTVTVKPQGYQSVFLDWVEFDSPSVVKEAIQATIMAVDTGLSSDRALQITEQLWSESEDAKLTTLVTEGEYTYYINGYPGSRFCAFHEEDLYFDPEDSRAAKYRSVSATELSDLDEGERIQIKGTVTQVEREEQAAEYPCFVTVKSGSETVSIVYSYDQYPRTLETGAEYTFYGTVQEGAEGKELAAALISR